MSVVMVLACVSSAQAGIVVVTQSPGMDELVPWLAANFPDEPIIAEATFADADTNGGTPTGWPTNLGPDVGTALDRGRQLRQSQRNFDIFKLQLTGKGSLDAFKTLFEIVWFQANIQLC